MPGSDAEWGANVKISILLRHFESERKPPSFILLTREDMVIFCPSISPDSLEHVAERHTNRNRLLRLLSREQCQRRGQRRDHGYYRCSSWSYECGTTNNASLCMLAMKLRI